MDRLHHRRLITGATAKSSSTASGWPFLRRPFTSSPAVCSTYGPATGATLRSLSAVGVIAFTLASLLIVDSAQLARAHHRRDR